MLRQQCLFFLVLQTHLLICLYLLIVPEEKTNLQGTNVLIYVNYTIRDYIIGYISKYIDVIQKRVFLWICLDIVITFGHQRQRCVVKLNGV